MINCDLSYISHVSEIAKSKTTPKCPSQDRKIFEFRLSVYHAKS